MNTWLPPHVAATIYAKVFESCLRELRGSALRVHYGIVRRYGCDTCGEMSDYPNLHAHSCAGCGSRVCGTCMWQIHRTGRKDGLCRRCQPHSL